MQLFLKRLEITPTSALSFRKLPMSHKMISSYSFIPPTVLSGFLYRLIRLSRGEMIPIPKMFKNDKPITSEYFILENHLTSPETNGVFSLGAYPVSYANFTSFRMGYQDISLGITFASDLMPFRKNREDIISLLEQNSNKFEDYKQVKEKIERAHNDYRYFKTVENIISYYDSESTLNEQMVPDHSRVSKDGKITAGTSYDRKIRRAPIDWEFTVSDSYSAYLVSENKESLSIFDCLKNYGYKIGKEGFAFVSHVFETQELSNKNGKFKSSVIISLDSGAHYPNQMKFELLYFFDGKSFSKSMFAREGFEVVGDFLTTVDNQINIPKVTLAKLGCLS